MELEAEETTNTIMAALSTISPSNLSELTNSILSFHYNHHCYRLSSILSSSTLFSLTLRRLLSLSLPDKSLLLARFLLHLLRLLTLHLQPPPLRRSSSLKLRDLDAVVLLLFLCETHQLDSEALNASPDDWRAVLKHHYSDTILNNISGMYVPGGGVLIPYIEMVTRLRRFIGAMGGKEGKEVAAAVEAVVALPAVEVRGGGGGECAICKEEMREGRDVCEMPCKHLFHWMCILPWLDKRNTCPCCRFQLPTDDLVPEIQRLWGLLIKASEEHFSSCG